MWIYFFYKYEWKNITIDTRLPKHQNNEFSLSKTPDAYWMCLFEKAYAKAFTTYSSNCIHNILEAQEDNVIRLIYLVNYWAKGKSTFSYSFKDETW